jgi:tRNA1Val (adenine37-N6)-methyltransferase
MANSYFRFKQFTIEQQRAGMKVTTDACLFGGWVAAKLSEVKPATLDILDVGTGTGLLSLMLAQKITASIDAIEMDKDSFEQARENIIHSPWKEHIQIMEGNALNHPFLKKYDIVISNPPFYENELRTSSEKKNLARHEGLSLEELLGLIGNILQPQGKFYLLLPFKRENEVLGSLGKFGLAIQEIVYIRQSVSHDFFRIMLSGCIAPGKSLSQSELSIKNEQDEYTEEFIEILKDYYLHL